MITPPNPPNNPDPPRESATENNTQHPGKRAETVLTARHQKPFYTTRSNPETHPQRAITRKGIEEATNSYK